MTRTTKIAILCGGAALLFAAGSAMARTVETDPGKANVPSSWGYELKNGKRVPKGERVTNADGSWREEIRQGNCTTVKEMSASGDLKVSRKCD